MSAFSELQACLYMAEKVLLQVKIREDILDDPVYRHISSVDKVNQLVMGGMPFQGSIPGDCQADPQSNLYP